jgi:hypothetical protein
MRMTSFASILCSSLVKNSKAFSGKGVVRDSECSMHESRKVEETDCEENDEDQFYEDQFLGMRI